MSKILVINPGSTSTKIAVFEDEDLKITETIRYGSDAFASCEGVLDQKDIRKDSVLDTLSESGISMDDIDIIMARGGLVKPIESGVYRINQKMLEDLHEDFASGHASSLAAIIADELAQGTGIPCYIADPVVTDEMEPCARLSGLPLINRESIFHALNTKSVARKCAAEQLGKSYEDCRMVIAHMGGGISVGAHRYGRVIDVNDALYGEGPFSPERSGGLPAIALVDLCFEGTYSKEEIKNMITKSGGMTAYIGTNTLPDAEQMAENGDADAELVIETMAYQIAKEIGSMMAVLDGQADAVILTGGLAYSKRFVSLIKQKVIHFAPVYVYPGENEMEALAEGAVRIINGEETAKDYV